VRNTCSSASPAGSATTSDVAASAPEPSGSTTTAGRSAGDGPSSHTRSSTRSTPTPVTADASSTGTASLVRTSCASVRSRSAAPGSSPARYASSWSSSCVTISSTTSSCSACSSSRTSAGTSSSWPFPSPSYSRARSVRTSATPCRDCSSPSGSSSGTNGASSVPRSASSTVRKLARARSSWETTTRRGIPASSQRRQASSVPACTPSTALTTTTARSATASAESTHPAKSGEPGVSSSVTWYVVPSGARQSRCATPRPTEMPRATSSGSWSHTVVPSATEPARGIAPARWRNASASVVLPAPLCPTRATLRVVAGPVDDDVMAMAASWHAAGRRVPPRSRLVTSRGSCPGRRSRPGHRLQVGVRVGAQGVAHERGALDPAVALREPLVRDVHLAEADDVLLDRSRAGTRRAGDAAEPLDVATRQRLRLLGLRGDPPGGRGRPVLAELARAGEPGRAVVVGHLAPPRVAARVRVLAPAVLDLVLVLRVVEPVEHVVRHELATSFHRGDRPFDRRDLPRQPLPLRPQPLQVAAQRPHLGGAPCRARRRPVAGAVRRPVERLADRGEPEPEVPQEQDPLEPHERVGVVVAVAVGREPGGRQQPDRVVVPQRAARRPREARDLLDGPGGRAPARRARGGHGRVSFPVFASRVRRRGPR